MITLLGWSFVLALISSAKALQSLRPNIVILLVDDMGWNDIGFHGSDQIPTPNVDALAYNGIILNKHYVQPVCTPSRTALMSGLYPIHTGSQGDPTLINEPNGLPLDVNIMPEYFKDLGYKTHMVGKWHLGFYRHQFTPLQRGFDSFLGLYGGWVGYYDYICDSESGSENFYGVDIRRNDTTAWDLIGKYATDVFSNEAVRIIRDHTEEEPLFMYMAFSAVHSTHKGRLLEAPQARVNAFKHIIDPNRRTYAAMVSKMDDAVGEIVEALREKAMLDNTIILFMSDNGAPSSEKGTPYPNWGSNFPLRGAKQTLWEGGVKTPSFIWSSQFQQNPRVSNQLIHITDWLPTLYTAAGGDKFALPQNLDGIDQWYSLVWNLPSRRTQALLNINEKERSAGIVATFDTFDVNKRTWKLLVGTFSNGDLDSFYNDVRSPMNPPYDYRKIVNSKAYRAINTLFSPTTKEVQMRFLRNEATVSCARSIFDDYVPDCSLHPCLFNLENDPCEKIDLAPNNTALVQRLYNTLKIYRKTLVPQRNLQPDPDGANPAKFNNTWSTWIF